MDLSLAAILTILFSVSFVNAVVLQPQVADLRITSFENFGDIVDRKSHSLTVTCVEGSGSGQIRFTKEPSDTPISITPVSVPSPCRSFNSG